MNLQHRWPHPRTADSTPCCFVPASCVAHKPCLAGLWRRQHRSLHLYLLRGPHHFVNGTTKNLCIKSRYPCCGNQRRRESERWVQIYFVRFFPRQILGKVHNQFRVRWEWGEVMVVGEEGNLCETMLVYWLLFFKGIQGQRYKVEEGDTNESCYHIFFRIWCGTNTFIGNAGLKWISIISNHCGCAVCHIKPQCGHLSILEW